MKKCPVCEMTVDVDAECPFCKTALTHEPKVISDKEHIIFNKYFLIYTVKKTWFAVNCALFCLIKILLSRSFTYITVFVILFCAISLLVSFTQRNMSKMMGFKYSEKHVPFKIIIWKYVLGACAVIYSLFL